MSESWPPPEYPRSPHSRPARPPHEPSGPAYGDGHSGPGYGSWAPPSGGRGQPPSGGRGQPPPDGWGQPPSGGWGQAQDGPWTQAPGPTGQYAPGPYPYEPSTASPYADRYGYGDPYSYGGPPEPQPRRSAGLVLQGVLVLAIILLAAGGAYALTHPHQQPGGPAAPQTNTPPPVRALTHPTANRRFQIPQSRAPNRHR